MFYLTKQGPISRRLIGLPVDSIMGGMTDRQMVDLALTPWLMVDSKHIWTQV